MLSRLNTGGVNLKLGPTFTRGPVFINGYFHHFWQKHKMNRNKMSPVSCVVDVIQNKGRRIYRMLIRGYNTFRQLSLAGVNKCTVVAHEPLNLHNLLYMRISALNVQFEINA